MKIIYFLTSLFIVFNNNVCSQTINYVLKDSVINVNEYDAVFLRDSVHCRIKNEDESVVYHFRRIQINSSKADELCRVILRESEFIQYDDIKAVIKDSSGKAVKELDDDEINEGEYSFNTLYSGHNYKWFKLDYHTYPFILEYSYVVEKSSLFFWSDWYPQNIDYPTLTSIYELRVPENIQFHYKTVGIQIKPAKSILKKDLIFKWRMDNIPEILEEFRVSPEEKYQMYIKFSPVDFTLEGYKGSFESWESFGKWAASLYKDRFSLPNSVEAEIKEIVKDIPAKRDKISAIYRYLQSQCRYVAVEMGIHGYQSPPAENVFNNKYGDCKGLTVLMIAMLRSLGISAYPALALTRTEGLTDSEFPENLFNHVIAFIPDEKDTLWLECTSKYGDSGNMPYEIEGINALVIFDEGGVLIKTPTKGFEQNKFISSVAGVIENNGNLIFDFKISSSGNQKAFLQSAFTSKNIDDRIKFILDYYGRNYPGILVDKDKIEITDKYNSLLNIRFTGIIKKFTVCGNRLIINPVFKTFIDDVFNENIEERVSSLFFNYPFLDSDTVRIKIPEDYVLEFLPGNTVIEKDFAVYSSGFSFIDNELCYTRTFGLKKRQIKPDNFGDYTLFLKEVTKADKAKAVFKKGNNY